MYVYAIRPVLYICLCTYMSILNISKSIPAKNILGEANGEWWQLLRWVFLADSVCHIHALSMQYPARVREVHEIDNVNRTTVKALLEFHEGWHIIQTYGELTHQVLCASSLG